MSVAAEPVRIRPWRSGDEALLAASGRDVSAASLYARFFTGMSRLPVGYLRYVASAPRERWDAVVAVRAGRVIGWAEYGRYRDAPHEADLAVLVVDAWQRLGLGSALVRQLLPRCRRAGVAVRRSWRS